MSFSQKLKSRIASPRSYGSFIQEEAAMKNFRLCMGEVGKKEEGNWLVLYFLIDEEDGEVADAKFQVFGPPALVGAADILAELVLRKNYLQAARISADLIDKQVQDKEGKAAFPEEAAPYLNLVLEAVDLISDQCMDIPIADTYIAPPEMVEGERQVYPNWETLSDEQKKGVIIEVMDKEVRPYVELDAGGVEVLKIEENRVTIAYSGNCTSCFSATGATLDAIGSILRNKIFPDLMVIPDMSLLQ
ncbi:MAG: hypothetical protein KR126chlam1_00876 [Chlamydiae bacterium]|nr:hypothetical protein [Chlamydiota bacterium]